MTAQPLDPYTLRVVIEHVQKCRRTAGGQVAAELDCLGMWLTGLADEANPSTRVVVLPEADGVDDDGEPYWPGDEFESVTVELSVENKHHIYFPSSCQTVDQARIIAGSILAAAEFAGGAQ